MTIKAPRWGFRIGWEDFIVAVRREAHKYGLQIDDKRFVDGIVPLPEAALYEAWDLRPLGGQCRDLEPHEWTAAIRRALFEMYGREGTVEIVEAAPASARVVPIETTLRDRLRFQLIDRTDAMVLAGDQIAVRPFADLGAVLLDGGRPATYAAIERDGLDREQAFLIALQNSMRDTGPDMQTRTLDSTNATCEVAVANRDYACAVMLGMHSQMESGLPLVLCPLTTHHWIMATLKPTATRDTLREIDSLAGTLRAQFDAENAKLLAAKLWWWPGGVPTPTPFEVDGELPAALAALIQTPS